MASQRHQEFVENCKSILKKADGVTIDEAALDAFASTLKASAFVPDWKEYVSDAANADPYDIQRAFFELALNIANQSGFIYAEKDGRMLTLEEAGRSENYLSLMAPHPQKWNVEGSGARAMVLKMAEIRAAGALPYIDIGPDEVDAKIGPMLQGVPYAEKRLAIFREFATQEAWDKVGLLLAGAFDGQKYVFDMDFAASLAQSFPESFGGDSFLKKAVLLPLIFAGHAGHHRVESDVSDLTVAADYVLPRVLSANEVGILKLEGFMQGLLRDEKPMHENSTGVEGLRAAAIVICERLAEKTGLTPREIDGALWGAGRKIKDALPHMMCYTMRF